MSPTVFRAVEPGTDLWSDEVFGPLIAVKSFRDVQEAVALANSSAFGLASYVWTSKLDRGFNVAKSITSGYTLINPCLPIGDGPGHGFTCEPARQSGIGVEGGLAGLKSYMRRQTLWFNHGNPF